MLTRYALHGTGSELFDVDPISGRISVAACHSENEISMGDGVDEGVMGGDGGGCLDFESTKAYFLSYSATDDNGEGRRSVVNLRVTVGDANDNHPRFDKKAHSAAIDEGQTDFQPRLVLRARDADESSNLQYRIVDASVEGLFAVDAATGSLPKVEKWRGFFLANNLHPEFLNFQVR